MRASEPKNPEQIANNLAVRILRSVHSERQYTVLGLMVQFNSLDAMAGLGILVTIGDLNC